MFSVCFSLVVKTNHLHKVYLYFNWESKHKRVCLLSLLALCDSRSESGRKSYAACLATADVGGVNDGVCSLGEGDGVCASGLERKVEAFGEHLRLGTATVASGAHDSNPCDDGDNGITIDESRGASFKGNTCKGLHTTDAVRAAYGFRNLYKQFLGRRGGHRNNAGRDHCLVPPLR